MLGSRVRAPAGSQAWRTKVRLFVFPLRNSLLSAVLNGRGNKIESGNPILSTYFIPVWERFVLSEAFSCVRLHPVSLANSEPEARVSL